MEETIYTKLLAIQSELRAPKNQYNSYGGFSYRSCEDILEAVKPLLLKHGLTLVISDEPVMVGERQYIKATATVRCGQEYMTASAYAREAESKKGMDESQVTGTASSYARKYALNGLFLIDDARDADTEPPQRHDDGRRADQRAANGNGTRSEARKQQKPISERIAEGKARLMGISPWTEETLAPILEPLTDDEKLQWLIDAFREAKAQMGDQR